MGYKFGDNVGYDSDSAATSGNGSIIAILKALRTSLASLAGAVSSTFLQILLQRDWETVDVTVADGAYLSAEVDMRKWAGFSYYLSSLPVAANMAWVSASATGGTFKPCDNSDSTPALIEQDPTAQRWISAPADLFPLGFVKFWFQNSEVDAGQTGGLTISVQRKG